MCNFLNTTRNQRKEGGNGASLKNNSNFRVFTLLAFFVLFKVLLFHVCAEKHHSYQNLDVVL